MVVAFVHKEKFLFSFLAGLFIVVAGIAAYSEQYFLAAIPFAILIFYAGWLNRNIVFLVLLISLPLSFEYSFSSTLGTDIPDELLMLFVSGLFIAYWVYSPGALSKNILRHPLLLLLSIGLCWTVISVLFSSQPLISLKFLLAKGWYVGAFILAPVIIFREKKFIKIAAASIAGPMFFIAGIALVRHYNYGFRFANINDAVYPFFRNHVNYSAMLVCTMPVLFAFFRAVKKRNMRLFTGCAIVVVLIALAFSYARGAWLALLLGILAYWLIRKRLLFYAFITAIIFLIFSVLWLKNNDRYLRYSNDFKTTIFHKDFAEHLVATYKLKDVSTAERFYRWVAGTRMIKDNWLTGYGPNTFYENYKEYAVPAFKTWVSDNKDHSTVHNYFLLIAVEQGIPGLLFFIVLLGAMLYYAQYLYHRVKDLFYKATAMAVGVIVTMIIMVNFLSDLIETDKIGSLFFLCIATLIVTDVNTRRGSDSSPHIKSIS
ncbi:MAG TPA: O-antigen ligase family protein [Chitinophagaceae bacterium]